MHPIRIGCSGWSYRHWRGLLYPEGLPTTRWFARYAERFDTVELNSSFYHLPPETSFAKWAREAPPGFAFAVKAPRYITHVRKLLDVAEPLAEFLRRARLLGPTLGPILYQLPPRWRFNRDRLGLFLALLPRDLAHVFEFREASWQSDEALAMLEASGASFCTHDMPGMNVRRRAVGPVAYVRFHGTAGKYVGRYSDDALADWAGWMAEQAAVGRQVWAYFNNDIHGHALDDAAALKKLLAPSR